MAEDEEKKEHTSNNGNGQKSLEITPIQLLEVILKAVLKDRITDEEAKRICSVYYKTIEDWWGEH